MARHAGRAHVAAPVRFPMRCVPILCCAALAFLPDPAWSKPPALWEVYTTSNGPFAYVTLERYEHESLYMRSGVDIVALHQDSVRYLRHSEEGYPGARSTRSGNSSIDCSMGSRSGSVASGSGSRSAFRDAGAAGRYSGSMRKRSRAAPSSTK